MRENEHGLFTSVDFLLSEHELHFKSCASSAKQLLVSCPSHIKVKVRRGFNGPAGLLPAYPGYLA